MLLLYRKASMEFIYQANELKSATNARKNTFLLTIIIFCPIIKRIKKLKQKDKK